MKEEQRIFLEQLALRIPRLFEAIALGNVQAEFIVGMRRVGRRQVRLKLVAEVVDSGSNPLETHGRLRAVAGMHFDAEPTPDGATARGRKRVDREIRNGDAVPAAPEVPAVAGPDRDPPPRRARRRR